MKGGRCLTLLGARDCRGEKAKKGEELEGSKLGLVSSSAYSNPSLEPSGGLLVWGEIWIRRETPPKQRAFVQQGPMTKFEGDLLLDSPHSTSTQDRASSRYVGQSRLEKALMSSCPQSPGCHEM